MRRYCFSSTTHHSSRCTTGAHGPLRPRFTERKNIEMADTNISPATALTVAPSKAPRTHEQLRRKAHDRFISPATQEALSDAIYGVPGSTVFDHQRITEQLAERLNDQEFLNAHHFKQFRVQAVAFVTRQAELTAKVRVLMPELKEAEAAVYDRLHNYSGDVEDEAALRAWIGEVTHLHSEGIDRMYDWIIKYRNAVYSDIYKFLDRCSDLEKNLDDVADSIASEIWLHVADHAADYLQSATTLCRRLKKMGYWRARAWKTKRLADIAKGVVLQASDKFTIGLDGIERTVTGDEGEVELGAVVDEVISAAAIHNPLEIQDLMPKWTDADLERELRRAGPFRACESDEFRELLPIAA